MSPKIAIGLGLLPLLALGGCRDTYYELELRPEGDVLERRLVLWKEGDSANEYGRIASDFVAPIAAAYGMDVPENTADLLEFRGRFGPDMPADIGGNGTYRYWSSSLGSLYYYSESFRGNDAPADLLVSNLTVIDDTIDALAAWLGTEYAGTDRIDEIISGLHGPLRDDARNLFVYLWLSAIGGPRAYDTGELMDRCLRFLEVRGYVDLDDAPAIYMALESVDSGDGVTVSPYIARGVANRIGLDPAGPLPPVLAALGSDVESFFDAFEVYRAEQGIEPIRGIEFDIFGTSGTYLRIALRVPVVPFATNGERDDPGRVTWRAELASSGDDTVELPNHAYATWAVADTGYQQKRFGSVVLVEDELADYVLWRNSLSEPRATEWDALLDSFEDGAGAAQAIRKFRFSDAGDDPEAGRVDDFNAVRHLLRELPADTGPASGEQENAGDGK